MAPQRGSRNSKNASSNKGKKKLVKTLTVGPFRIGFESLLTPEDTDNGEKYTLTMLFPDKGCGRETPESLASIKEIDDAFFDVMEDYFGPEDDWPSGKKDTLPEDKFYDAGKKKDYPGFSKGWMVLKASSNDAPGVVGPDKEDILSKREIYRGRWARAVIAITTFDNTSKGATAYLNHVQLLDHDEAFSGRGSAQDAFDKYEMDDRDDNRRGGGRGRDRDDDEDDRGGRGRSRGRDDDDREDRDRNRSRSREDDDEDRGSRRSSRKEEDEDDRGSRGRGRSSREDDDDDRSGRGESRSRGRGGDKDDGRRSSRDDDDRSERGRGRGRDDVDEDRDSRRRGRDEDEAEGGRGRSRGRDEEDRGSRSERSSGRGRESEDRGGRDSRDDERSSRSRSRDDDDERPSNRGRGKPRDGDRDEDWN